MITYFSRIRKFMINKNRLGKYFYYAIGEVILIVLGILIAVEVNNNNENNKSNQKIDLIMQDVLIELSRNIGNTHSLFRFYNQKDSIYKKYVNYEFSFDELTNEELYEIYNLTQDITEIELGQFAYEHLTNNLDVIPSKYKEAVEDLTKLNLSDKKGVELYNIKMDELVNDNTTYRVQNNPFYSSTKMLRDDLIKIILDWRFKNEAKHYWDTGINGHLNYALTYRDKAIKCYQKIAKSLDRPIIDQSFMVDEKTFELWEGVYYSRIFPERTLEVFEVEERLYYVFGNDNVESEIIPFSVSNGLDSHGNYFSIKVTARDTTIINEYDLYSKVNNH